MIIIAIDPGQNGGIAVLNSDTRKILYRTKMPCIVDGEVDVVRVAKILYKFKKQNAIVFLEKVQNIKGASSRTTFAFGLNLGLMKGIIGALRMECHMVHPKTWQKVAWAGVTPKTKKENGRDKTDTKATSLVSAKRLFPSEDFLATAKSRVPHDGIVDAVLIGYYGVKTWKG